MTTNCFLLSNMVFEQDILQSLLLCRWIPEQFPQTYSLSARILHRAPPPPRLQVDQNFLTQKIVADPKMQCH